MILQFAKSIVEKKAWLDEKDVMDLKKVGVSDRELIEVFLVTLQNLFSNYFNHIFNPDLDFPGVEPL